MRGKRRESKNPKIRTLAVAGRKMNTEIMVKTYILYVWKTLSKGKVGFPTTRVFKIVIKMIVNFQKH